MAADASLGATAGTSGGSHPRGEETMSAEGARMQAGTPILAADHVSLRFGGVRALTDVSFKVDRGEVFSIIGPNGAGKTSMVNCISGRYRPTEGQLFYRGKDITSLNPNARASLGIGRTFQNLALFHHMSVLDNIMVGRHHLLKNNFI